MKPTAHVLLVVGLLLVVSALVLYLTPNPYASGNDGVQRVLWGSSALVIALLAAATGAAVLGSAMLRFGGKGYTETNSPARR